MEIELRLPADAAVKVRKYFEKSVDWCKQPVHVGLMPNQPDPDNRVLSVRVSRELYRKLQKEAQRCRTPFNEFVRSALLAKTDHVALNRADYEKILAEKQEYIDGLKKKRKTKSS